MSKRDGLIEELKRRLRLGLGNPTVIEGDGGIWGKWSRELPCVHIFEDTTDDTLIKPGLYQISLDIQIEYVTRLTQRRGLYTEGREKLGKLQKSMELDERFTRDRGLVTQGEDLAISYAITASDIVEVAPATLDVAVIYNFVFTERFLGYEPVRH